MNLRDQRGFSFPEVIVSVALFMTLSAIGLALFGTAISASKADSQVKRVVGMMQLARETAVSKQRDIELRIDAATNTLRLVRIEEDVEVLFVEVALEDGVRFARFEELGDTIEGFGGDDATEPVVFEGEGRLLFISDGSLVDQTDTPLNGAIFLAIPGQPHTARVIVLTGATARARSYRWNEEWAWVTQ